MEMSHGGHDKGEHAANHETMAANFAKRFWIVLGVAIPILALSPTIQGWLGFSLGISNADYILFGLATVVVLYGGWPFYAGALKELKTKNYGMMTLVSVAVLAGYFFSAGSTFFWKGVDFYWEISTLVLVLLFGHWIEMRAVIGAGGALGELLKLIPAKAHLIKGETVIDVDTNDVGRGERVFVKVGEKVPVDGFVILGESNVNESMITGEPKPVFKKPGDKVTGGTVSEDGALTVEATDVGVKSVLAHITNLIEEAQRSKPKIQRLADRAANYLTTVALLGGAITFAFWGLFFPQPEGMVFALTLAITVIVIACPHALGIAIPTVTTITASVAARKGMLIRDMGAVEKAKKLDYIVFDKTGTLTKGEFGVTDFIKLGSRSDVEIWRLAASVEANSLHSLALTVAKEAKRRGISFGPADNFRSVPGKGGMGEVAGETIIVGSGSLMEESGFDVKEFEDRISDLHKRSRSLVWVATKKEILAVIGLADEIRPEAGESMMVIRKMGIEIVMLTGDTEASAASAAKELGIGKFFAKVLPENKIDKIKELQRNGKVVAMVGDGINDAPSLAQADIGIAIGAGTDVAIESAEVILIKNDLRDVVSLVKLSRRTMSKINQNLVWAVGYNLFAIPVAAGVLYPWGILLRPEWGALLMSASSIIVVLNALTLRIFR
ncbi:MAG: heavy metal translocating P-type ATPase [Candidatus Colwellbacteria bacterium]|nr:heavy metal translocating P-type ATPase [Candidatus Colwellbacteria bacterium]